MRTKFLVIAILIFAFVLSACNMATEMPVPAELTSQAQIRQFKLETSVASMPTIAKTPIQLVPTASPTPIIVSTIEFGGTKVAEVATLESIWFEYGTLEFRGTYTYKDEIITNLGNNSIYYTSNNSLPLTMYGPICYPGVHTKLIWKADGSITIYFDGNAGIPGIISNP